MLITVPADLKKAGKKEPRDFTVGPDNDVLTFGPYSACGLFVMWVNLSQ